jgi:DNA-binding transcriptional LysR family regulator
MELRHLRYFIAVAEERHITRAARRLGMQQPPLSQQIRSLETELGVTLFTRGARGVEVTAAGRAFLEDAYAIMESVSRASTRALRTARGEVGQLSIGFTTSAALHPLVPRVIRAFRDTYAGVALDLHEDAAAGLTEALMRRDIHLAVLRAPVAQPPDLAFVELSREELLVVLPVGHRLLARRGDSGVALRDLAGERFILVRRPGAPGIYENVIQACRAAGFEPHVAAEVPHMLTNINLVAAGVGISMVPASMREVNLDQVAYRSLRVKPKLTAPLTLAHVARDANPLARNFMAIALGMSPDRAK